MPPFKDTGILTVAAIRRPKGERVTQVRFNERQQIFALPSLARTRAEVSRLLQDALGRNQPVRAVLDPLRGVVQRVDRPSPAEIADFERSRTYLEKPDKTVRIDVAAIDPTTFNIVDRYLRFPSFRRCTRIVPNYTTARKIFDFCAKQSCHLPGPPSITPCIPFQYVRDGCYARAHKMRKIITSRRFGYCCEKVFSFANAGSDTLAVRADTWGGCCVLWWYHVAPLVRVRIRIGRVRFVLALVIDPSMFDKPVLLSSWLTAQANHACSANAGVSMYSIQPGSAYSPANHAGTAFTTDPAYTATDATLISYQNLTTCP
jgi:hypothetical protein